MSDDIEIKFKVEDMSAQVLNAVGVATQRALYAAGIAVQKGATDAISGLYTAENKAVDTGRLRASISFITSDAESGRMQIAPDNAKDTDVLHGRAEPNTMIFGSNVEYAAFVHNGTNKMQGRPFLREGLDRTKDEIRNTIEKIFKGEL